VTTRWNEGRSPRGDDYDERWRRLAASGENVHGEADLVDGLLCGLLGGPAGPADGAAVLDAGCGTGRVAIELARRGYDTVGVDLDRAMLDAARAKAPDLGWVEADLDGLDLGPGRRSFAAVVAAGNVMIFVAPGSEARVVASLARHLAPGGLLIAGFQLGPGRLDLAHYDAAASAAGLTLVDRWSTWDRAAFVPGGDYAVSVHRGG
jgi:SAM-dependent methyltransferase